MLMLLLVEKGGQERWGLLVASFPLISIITSTYNDDQAIRATLDCISNCAYSAIEYIVVDGGSTDLTQDVIHDAGGLISKSISEPDTGIYDAWNKGLRLATGQYIAFLGAGDVYVEGGLASLVKYALANPQADFISSKVAIHQDGVDQRIVGTAWQWKTSRRYMNAAHPGSLHSHRLFESYGEFDTSYQIAGDYEFLLRAGNTLQAAYVDEVTVRMAAGGISQSDFSVFREMEAAKIKNRAVPPWVARIDRYVAQSKYWIKGAR